MNVINRIYAKSILILVVGMTAGTVGTSFGAEKTGEALFKQHCAVCHQDGGNIVNPKKTLHKKDLEANNIKKEADIVHLMRNPGPGMNKFDVKLISDHDAKEIAEYILKKFYK
jgi:cytochrome c6